MKKKRADLTLGTPPSLGLTPLAILPALIALGDLMAATALDTFCTSLEELDLDCGVGGIFLGVLVLLSPAIVNHHQLLREKKTPDC